MSDSAFVDGAGAIPLEPNVTINATDPNESFGNSSPKFLFTSKYAQHCNAVKSTLKTLKLDLQDLKNWSWYDIQMKCIGAELSFYETFQLQSFYLAFQQDLIWSREISGLSTLAH
jgi:hypothetical protein